MKRTDFKICFFILIFFCFVSVASGSSELSFLEAKSGWGKINLQWKSKALSETESIVIVRKENECPKTGDDGLEIYRGNGKEFEDKSVEIGKSYCYGAFVYDISGRYSKMVLAEKSEARNFFSWVTFFVYNNNGMFWGIAILIFFWWLNKKTFDTGRKIKINI